MLWAVYCVSNPNIDIEAARTNARDAHRKYLKGKEDILFFTGPMLSDDGKKNIGSLFIVDVETRAEAKAFSDGEGYTRAGVFSSVTITRVGKRRVRPELGDE